MAGSANVTPGMYPIDGSGARFCGGRLIQRNIREVVKVHVAVALKHPQTLYYTGDGVHGAGKVISRRRG
jgi:hypothetical protein